MFFFFTQGSALSLQEILGYDFERVSLFGSQYPPSLLFLTCYDTSRELGAPSHIIYIYCHILLYMGLYTYIPTPWVLLIANSLTLNELLTF